MTGSTRRKLLAGIGTAAIASVAGCSLREDDDAPRRFASTEVDSMFDEPAPELHRPAPVQPPESVIDAGLARCADLVESVPASISSDEVPNGVVREEIESVRADAIDAREAVEAAPDRFRALLSLRDARRRAREAAVAFEAVRAAFADEIRAEQRETRTAVGTRLAQVGYSGNDRRRTLLAAFRAEELLTDARRLVSPRFGAPSPNALEVGEMAGDCEYVAATIDTVDGIAARHSAVTEGETDFSRSAMAASDATLRSLGRTDLPEHEMTGTEFLGEEPERPEIQHLLRNATRGVDRWRETLTTERDEGRFASGLSHAIQLERDVRALKTVVERIDDGDVPERESIEPIRDEREAAVAAAEAVPVSASDPSLAGDTLARSLQQLAWTDRELHGYVERETEPRLAREYARYVYLRAQLEALPDAIETIRERLGAG